MKKSKHHFKIFFTDDTEQNIINFDGKITECYTSREDMHKSIGLDIITEIDANLSSADEAVYGYRVDYTLTPIMTDPFK